MSLLTETNATELNNLKNFLNFKFLKCFLRELYAPQKLKGEVQCRFHVAVNKNKVSFQVPPTKERKHCHFVKIFSSSFPKSNVKFEFPLATIRWYPSCLHQIDIIFKFLKSGNIYVFWYGEAEKILCFY